MKYVTEPNYFTIVKFHKGEVLQFLWTTRSFPYSFTDLHFVESLFINKQNVKHK